MGERAQASSSPMRCTAAQACHQQAREDAHRTTRLMWDASSGAALWPEARDAAAMMMAAQTLPMASPQVVCRPQRTAPWALAGRRAPRTLLGLLARSWALCQPSHAPGSAKNRSGALQALVQGADAEDALAIRRAAALLGRSRERVLLRGLLHPRTARCTRTTREARPRPRHRHHHVDPLSGARALPRSTRESAPRRVDARADAPGRAPAHPAQAPPPAGAPRSTSRPRPSRSTTAAARSGVRSRARQRRWPARSRSSSASRPATAARAATTARPPAAGP